MRKRLAGGIVALAAAVGCFDLAGDHVMSASIPPPTRLPSVLTWAPLPPEALHPAQDKTDERRTITAPAGLRG